MEGYSPSERLAFDFAIVDFWDWYEAKTNERTAVPTDKGPGKGRQWGPKYETVQAILDLYDESERTSIRRPVLTDNEIANLIDDLMAEEVPDY